MVSMDMYAPARPRGRGSRTHGHASAHAVAVIALAWLVVFAIFELAAAEAQHTPYQRYEASIRDGSPRGAGVRFEMARAGGLWWNDTRGASAGMLAGGLGGFTLALDGIMLWQRDDDEAVEHSGYQVRLMVGISAIELYEFAMLRLELGAVFGQRLHGERDYVEFGLGALVSLPILYGADGWPVLRAEAGFGFAPVAKLSTAFRLESSLSVYPFVGAGSLRALGLQAGFFWGRDDPNPHTTIYLGLIYGAPLE